MKRLFLFLILTVSAIHGYAQLEPLWIHDSTFVKDLYIMRNRYQSLSFTGYLQVQYQHADSTGISSFNGGDFAEASDNRYMLRRGRFRLDYENRTARGFYKYYFALQFDGTEKGVNIRDMFGRIYENKWNYFVATTGVFNRPFGYELNYSSSQRESPERGRMSQILMKTERDIGVMLSFEPQDNKKKIFPLKIDAGLFNGQGLSGLGEFDSFKDFITRISMRRKEITKNLFLSGGISYLNGGFRNGSPIFYRTSRDINGDHVFVSDSSINNIGKKSPRVYYGTDIQLLWENTLGRTELRGEFITGTQSATYNTSVTPGIPPINKSLRSDSIFIRNFNGAYFYLLQTFLKKHQFFVKYDWYDPNIKVKGREITYSKNFAAADVRYDTFGAGYVFYMNDNLKFVLYYDHPVNEESEIKGYTKDLRDDTYTIRVQYRF
jgi:hypothetical protein